jgi:hypothetical protein
MRMKGLEPSLLTELEPKSSASANSATSANATYIIANLPVNRHVLGYLFCTTHSPRSEFTED